MCEFRCPRRLEASDPPEPELWVFVSCLTGAGSQSQILWGDKMCFGTSELIFVLIRFHLFMFEP